MCNMGKTRTLERQYSLPDWCCKSSWNEDILWWKFLTQGMEEGQGQNEAKERCLLLSPHKERNEGKSTSNHFGKRWYSSLEKRKTEKNFPLEFDMIKEGVMMILFNMPVRKSRTSARVSWKSCVIEMCVVTGHIYIVCLFYQLYTDVISSFQIKLCTVYNILFKSLRKENHIVKVMRQKKESHWEGLIKGIISDSSLCHN